MKTLNDVQGQNDTVNKRPVWVSRLRSHFPSSLAKNYCPGDDGTLRSVFKLLVLLLGVTASASASASAANNLDAILPFEMEETPRPQNTEHKIY